MKLGIISDLRNPQDPRFHRPWAQHYSGFLDLMVQLEELGFDPAVAPLLKGRTLARINLRCNERDLSGRFEGRRFRTQDRPPRVLGTTILPPEERRWRRLRDEPRG